jgi:hypothetical protein
MDIPPPGVQMSQLANTLGWKEKLMDSDYILRGHLWGGRFQTSVMTGERKVTGGMAGIFHARKYR